MRLQFFIIIIILILAGCDSTQTPVLELKDTYHPVNSETPISFAKLNNGITLIVKEDHRHPKVVMQIVVKAGSVNENDSTRGMAHSLEHMFFKTIKAKHGLFFSDYFRSLGVSNANAYTSRDHITFLFSSLPEDFEEVFLTYSDMIVNPIFTEEEFDREKQVIYEEYLTELNDPFYATSIRFMDILYGDHPYVYETIGYPELFLNLTPDMLYSYHARFFTTDNIYISIVGDIGTDKAISLVETAFKTLNNQTRVVKQRLQLNPAEENKTQRIQQDVGIEIVQLGYKIPGNLTKKDKFALLILGSILNEELSETFMMSGIALDAAAYLHDLENDNSIIVGAMFSSENEEQILSGFESIADMMRSGNINIKELEKHKNNMKLQMEQRFYTMDDEAELLVSYAINNDVREEEEMNQIYSDVELVNSISIDDIKRLAGTYLNNRVMLITEPK
ncbi:insulinase family protein [Candidatus Woesearchaeota archaeon]|nr:insulinase family protein [Candidatus Woesearchaeota archaeon]